MKKVYIIVLVILAVVILIGILGYLKSCRYERYFSKNPNLKISVDYLLNWKPSEYAGSRNSFYQLMFYEPPIKDNVLKAMMVITAYSEAKVAFEPKTLDGLAEDLIKRRAYFNSFKILSRKEKRYLGLDAIAIELSYNTMNMMDRIDARLAPYRERIVIFKKGGTFYVVRYAHFARDFNKYAKAFSHIVESLKFNK